jgi:hypothetical protein
MLRITDTVFIADWELTEDFIRSQGPGEVFSVTVRDRGR